MSYAYFGGTWECIDALVENGASLDARIGDWPILKHACKESRFAEAMRLVDLGANVYTSFEETRLAGEDGPPVSALHCCCLRKYGKDCNYSNAQAAWRSMQQNHLRIEMMETLLELDVKAGNDTAHWCSALLAAAEGHMCEAVYCLVGPGGGTCYVHQREAMRSAAGRAMDSRSKPSPRSDQVKTVEILLGALERDTAMKRQMSGSV